MLNNLAMPIDILSMKRFPIDILKIDRSFVSDLPTDAGEASIVNAVIRMGKISTWRWLQKVWKRESGSNFFRNRAVPSHKAIISVGPWPLENSSLLRREFRKTWRN
jgi:hypothetical protein